MFYFNQIMPYILLTLTILPTSLLLVYSAFEIIWSHKLSIKPSWIFTKASFLLIGVSLGHLLLSIGDRGLGLIPYVHNSFFEIAFYIYNLLAGAYIWKLIRISWPHKIGMLLVKQHILALVVRLITRIQKFLIDSYFVHIIAFIALLLLLVSSLFGKNLYVQIR
ncbi:MAG: hypothetical protein WCG97_00435 [bacterium]